MASYEFDSPASGAHNRGDNELIEFNTVSFSFESSFSSSRVLIELGYDLFE